jgi:hypothetical protein
VSSKTYEGAGDKRISCRNLALLKAQLWLGLRSTVWPGFTNASIPLRCSSASCTRDIKLSNERRLSFPYAIATGGICDQ